MDRACPVARAISLPGARERAGYRGLPQGDAATTGTGRPALRAARAGQVARAMSRSAAQAHQASRAAPELRGGLAAVRHRRHRHQGPPRAHQCGDDGAPHHDRSADEARRHAGVLEIGGHRAGKHQGLASQRDRDTKASSSPRSAIWQSIQIDLAASIAPSSAGVRTWQLRLTLSTAHPIFPGLTDSHHAAGHGSATLRWRAGLPQRDQDHAVKQTRRHPPCLRVPGPGLGPKVGLPGRPAP